MTQADRIMAALPQTQCTRCGYPDCAHYAQAIEKGEAQINQCPPGGDEGVHRLSFITGQPYQPLNPENGVESPRHVVWIDEAWCIGCTLCMEACPVDAIVGTHKRMHTVIEQDCTGCELCLPVCPVDCMHLEVVSGSLTGWQAWSAPQAQQAQQRYAARQKRWEAKKSAPSTLTDPKKSERIQAALIKAQQRRQPGSSPAKPT